MGSCSIAPTRLFGAVLLCVLCATGSAAGQGVPSPSSTGGRDTLVDLMRATVVTPETLSVPERTAVRVLVEEVEKRTTVRLPVATR